MKVLIASNSVGLWRGGHARNIMYLAQALQVQGVDIYIFTANILDEDVFEFGVPIIHADIGTYSLKKFAQSLSDHLLSHKYDLVHSNGSAVYKYLLKISKEQRIPSIFHARSNNLVNGIASLLDPYAFSKAISLKSSLISHFYEFWFDYRVIKRCDHVFTNCHDVLNRLNSVITINHRATVIHNGIILKDIQKSVRQTEVISPIVVGYLANHHLLKGWNYLASIIREVLKRNGDYRFMLAGDGPLHELLKRDLHEFVSSKQVVFIGRISDIDSKRTFFKSLDLFLCPAHAPTTVLEALSFQTPVIWLNRWQDCANGIDVEPFIDIGWIQKHRNLSTKQAAEVVLQYQFESLSTVQLRDRILDEYSWSGIAKKVVTTYQKVISESF